MIDLIIQRKMSPKRTLFSQKELTGIIGPPTDRIAGMVDPPGNKLEKIFGSPRGPAVIGCGISPFCLRPSNNLFNSGGNCVLVDGVQAITQKETAMVNNDKGGEEIQDTSFTFVNFKKLNFDQFVFFGPTNAFPTAVIF
uniref:Uncharacterized protein n=1 Tax=Romanomermis culicivorax TaxID=13658 RepID=A0A915KBE9_ROMCU